jgi:hypothetical protein
LVNIGLADTRSGIVHDLQEKGRVLMSHTFSFTDYGSKAIEISGLRVLTTAVRRPAVPDPQLFH